MTERVERLIELYRFLYNGIPPGAEGWRAEQMRLLSEMSPKESTEYYRNVMRLRATEPNRQQDQHGAEEDQDEDDARATNGAPEHPARSHGELLEWPD